MYLESLRQRLRFVSIESHFFQAEKFSNISKHRDFIRSIGFSVR